ncbi:MAG: outer membrane porin HofQ [bacterium ADurb.Bin243]|nr:MAG: outer membrane porin HofQ [bacterium ADurb.Bin243]
MKYIFLMILFSMMLVSTHAAAFELDCDEKPLHEVLKIFADELGVNIIADPKTRDIKVSVSLKNIEPEDALELVLKTSGLAFNRESANTYTIFKSADAGKYLSVNSCVFRISYASAEKVAEGLRLLFPQVNFVPDKKGNSIFAAGNFSDGDLAVMKEKIKLLDSKTPRVKVNYEILKIENNRVIESVLKLSSSPHGGAARAALNDIISCSRSLVKASITLIPSEKAASIESATRVPYLVRDGDGLNTRVEESAAGDIFSVRALSAGPEGATLEFSLDTGHFIGDITSGLPPASYSQRLTGVIEVKNREKVLAGTLSRNAFDKIISCGGEGIDMPGGYGAGKNSVISSIRADESDCYIYMEAEID